MNSRTTGAPRFTIHIKAERLAAAFAARGWENDFQAAQDLGVAHTTIGRLRAGGRPGERLIAAVLGHLGLTFEELFEIVAHL